MGRATSWYGIVIPSGAVINDRLFLTLNGAGTYDRNPILLGLGARILIDVNFSTRAVRAAIRRVTDLGNADERDITGSIQKITDSRYEISGAIGGDTLGFPNNPTVDYSTPQLFEMIFMAVGRARTVVNIYQFWVQEGHIHSLKSCDNVFVDPEEELAVEHDLVLELDVTAIASGECDCECTVDCLSPESDAILDNAILSGVTTPAELFDYIFGPDFARNHSPIDNLDPSMSLCLYQNYLNACYYGYYYYYCSDCWCVLLGGGLTLDFFEGLLYPNPEVGEPPNYVGEDWDDYLGPDLLNLAISEGVCECTCTYQAVADANATASVTGNITATCGDQVIVLPVNLNDADSDNDVENGTGP